MKDTFISYSRKNKVFVQQLAEAFQQAERDIWIDREGIAHGSDWWNEIEEGIQDSNCFIFIITPESIASEICDRELQHAIDFNKRLIPILRTDITGKIPDDLAKLDWIFFRDSENFEDAFSQLLDTIDSDLDRAKQHTKLLNRALEWRSKNCDKSLLLTGNELSEAQQWLALPVGQPPNPTPVHSRFIMTSSQALAKNQRYKLIAVGFALILAVFMTIFANHLRQVAQKQRNIAIFEQNRATALEIEAQTALSTANLSNDNQLDALLSAVKAGQNLTELKINLSNDKQLSDLLEKIKSKQNTNMPSILKANNQLVKLIEHLSQTVPDVLKSAIYNTQERNRLEKHLDKVRYVTFSPDGKKIATASSDHTVNIWNRIGHLKQTLLHPGAVNTVNFSSDSEWLITAARDKYIRVWDSWGELLLKLSHQSKALNALFSPNKKLIAGGFSNGDILIWTNEGKLLKTIHAHDSSVEDLDFNPDSRYLVSGSADRTVKIWDMQNFKLHKTLIGHQDRVYAVDFSPLGKQLISTGADNTLRFWNIETGLETKKIAAHKNWVYDVSYSPAGDMIASSSATGKVKLWSPDGTLLKVYNASTTRVIGVSFSPDGNTLATAAADKRVKLYNIGAGTTMKILEGHTSGLKDVDFSPDGSKLASTGTDATIRIWDSKNHKHLKKIDTGVNVRDVDFVPQSANMGNMLIAATYNNSLQFWDLNGQLHKTITETEGKIKSVAIDPRGKFMVTTSTRNLQLWTLAGEKLRLIKTGHKNSVNAISFSPDGSLFASVSSAYDVKLWSREGKLIHTFEGHKGWVNNLSFSPDNRYLATASSDMTIKVWNLSDGSLLNTLVGHDDWVWDVDFYPTTDKPYLISAGSDRVLRLWNYLDGKELYELKGHKSWVRAVGFSASGDEIASASADETIILWDFKRIEKNLNTGQNKALNNLLVRGCSLLKNYLESNSVLSEHDKSVCKNTDDKIIKATAQS